MQEVTNADQVAGTFGALLLGVRACAPKCAECRRPLSDEQEQTHLRAATSSDTARICHSCFIGELADALVNTSPGLR